MTDSENVNVFWLRNDNNHPVTLVAWAQDGRTAKYATATHNSPDEFCRTHAHNKAVGRLRSDKPEFVSVVIVDDHDGPEATIANHILATRRGDETLAPPRVWLAARASVKFLVNRHVRRQERAVAVVAAN